MTWKRTILRSYVNTRRWSVSISTAWGCRGGGATQPKAILPHHNPKNHLKDSLKTVRFPQKRSPHGPTIYFFNHQRDFVYITKSLTIESLWKQSI